MGNGCHTAKTDDDRDIKFGKQIYAEGSVRYAYRGIPNSENLIVKTFKKRVYNTKENWERDISASLKADLLAKKFIKELNTNPNSPYGQIGIKFIIPYTARVHTASCVITTPNKCVLKDQYVLIEQYLAGSYMKYSDNQGFETKELGEMANVLFAFSHWTYERNDDNLLVSDLQGVCIDGNFLLTDPAIHSQHMQYGLTDLSFAGMKRVMNGHTCNELCKHLELSLHVSTKTNQPESRTILSMKLSKKEKRRNKELQQQRTVSPSQIETEL